MATTITEYVAQIAEAIATVEQRRQLLAELRAELEPLARTKLIVVDGEVLQLNRLQQLLDTVVGEIDALRAAKELDETDEHMGKINDALSDVRWELVDSIKDVLNKKAEQQKEILRQQRETIQHYEARLNQWPPLSMALNLELDKATRERAPVRLEKHEIERLDGLVSTIRRDLDEGRHAALQEQLDSLDASRTKVTEWLKKIPELTRETIQFKQQADLLLLQSPLDARKLYRYTVLLRTASGSGTHGINIQEKCTLVEHDRKEMADVIDEITKAVNRGVTRDFQIRKDSSAPTGAAPPPEATGETGAAASAPANVPAALAGTLADGVAVPVGSATPPVADDPLRRAELVIPATSPLGSLYPEDLNELVKRVGDFMYRIFMSHQLQDYLNASPCSLTITTNDLMLPWELMSYRDRNEPEGEKF